MSTSGRELFKAMGGLNQGVNSGNVAGRRVEYQGKTYRVSHITGTGKDAHASLDIVNPQGVTGAEVKNEILRLPLSVLSKLPTVTNDN